MTTPEQRLFIDEQWFARGNLSQVWFFLGSRPDGSASGLAERVPSWAWPLLDDIVRLKAGIK